MSPVYWKPKYPTRSMRERAYAKRDLAREAAAKSQPAGKSLIARILDWLRR